MFTTSRVILLTVKQTNKHTGRQTADKRRQKHNLTGEGKSMNPTEQIIHQYW